VRIALGCTRIANGLAWASSLDQDSHVSSYTLGGAVDSLQRYAANQIFAITHATTPYWSRGYAYNGLDRIGSFVSEPRDQIFSYDVTGNLLVKTDRVGSNAPFGTTYTVARC